MRVLRLTSSSLLAACVLAVGPGVARVDAGVAGFARIASVTDGDTVRLADGRRVRLVQIDTPEVFFGTECYGPAASQATKRLLPPGTPVRLLPEPKTDLLDRYGRLLRYVVRERDGLDVNLRLISTGAAAPYFYAGRRGRFANLIERAARRARAQRLGLWGRCPGTPYDPYRAVDTGPRTP